MFRVGLLPDEAGGSPLLNQTKRYDDQNHWD